MFFSYKSTGSDLSLPQSKLNPNFPILHKRLNLLHGFIPTVQINEKTLLLLQTNLLRYHLHPHNRTNQPLLPYKQILDIFRLLVVCGVFDCLVFGDWGRFGLYFGQCCPQRN